MIRFEVNGEYLELPADFSLQFKRTNILFAFDDIECERSTSFNIPATPQNNRIFALAKWVQSDGVGMRRRYEAQMQAGLVVLDGYLHIDQYDAVMYKAVFVTGELLGLKKIREAGKIKEYWTPAGGIVWSVSNIKDANTYNGQVSLAITRYVSNVNLMHPSFDLRDVIQYAYNALTGRNIPAMARGYRLIPKEVQGMPKTSITFSYTGTGADFEDNPEDASFANTITQAGALSAIGTTNDTVLLVGVGGTRTQYKYIKVRQWIANQTLILTFPTTFPNNMFLMSLVDPEPEYNWLSRSWFLGGWRFYQRTGGGVSTDGTPLAGRSVTIPRGTRFVFLCSDDYEYEPSPLNWNGFRWIAYRDYSYEMVVEAETPTEGDTIRAYDMLPDLTLVELLKIYSYLEGKALNYTETDGVLFDDLDVDNWEIINVDGKVVKAGNVARKFGNYAQRNVIDFESGTEVLTNQRLQLTYEIDNDNLQEIKRLGKIPYSEGQIAERDGSIVARFDAEDTEKNVLYAAGIMKAVGTSTTAPKYGTRVELQKNSGLQSLLDASTCMTIQVQMTLLEFNQLQPKKAIYFEGVRYVWTEANWTKNVATIKISKIPA